MGGSVPVGDCGLLGEGDTTSTAERPGSGTGVVGEAVLDLESVRCVDRGAVMPMG